MATSSGPNVLHGFMKSLHMRIVGLNRANTPRGQRRIRSTLARATSHDLHDSGVVSQQGQHPRLQRLVLICEPSVLQVPGLQEGPQQEPQPQPKRQEGALLQPLQVPPQGQRGRPLWR